MSFKEGFQTVAGFDAACANIASAPCQAFITTAIGDYTTNVLQNKDNSVANVMYNANRVFDADKNSSYALIRSNDVIRAQTALKDVTQGDVKKVEHDVELTRRQFEINEYHYHNKLDTLFFLQVFFIAVLVIAILMYFNRQGLLTTQMTGLLMAILAVIVFIIGVSRYFYTIRTRDRRLWHRRYFQAERNPPEQLFNVCGPSAAKETTINLNALFSNSQIQCGLDANEEYDRWAKTVNAEAEAQMKGENATSIFSTGFNKPASCKRR